MITVRSEMNKDKAEIQNVINSAVATLRQTYRPTQKATEKKILKNQSHQRLVAIIDDRIVGTVQYFSDNHCIKVIGLDVHTNYRKKGVARRLIAHIKEIGIKEKALVLKLVALEKH